MKTKSFALLLLVILLQNCTPEFQNTPDEPVEYVQDDITTLVVPNGHDLRPLALQNTNINLSEESRADMVNIRMYKVENDTNILLYEGFIDKEKSINNITKIPNHVELIAVHADLATGTREWIVTPSELQNVVIEDEEIIDDEESKTATETKLSAKINNDPPSWSCNDYDSFNGNDDGSYSISNTSTQGINVNQNTTIYICDGASWSPSYLNDNNNKLTIYVAQGGTLKLSGTLNSTIYNEGTVNGVNLGMNKNSSFNNWGTTNITGNLNTNSKDLNVYAGVFNISGSLNLNSDGDFENDGGQVNIGGHCTLSGDFDNEENSTLNVAGNFTINSNGDFKNECQTIISGNFINNNDANFRNASYTVITGSLTNNSNTDFKLREGSILKCASIMSNDDIKGSKGYSVIETGSITFNGNRKFEGNLDICSDYYSENMGDNDVLNTCSTFISSGTCSPGFQNAIDSDNDGVVAGVDVDDENPNVSTYNYPQGQDSFYTSFYEDLYPCMGDYDLNDLVHNYSYQEGIDKNETITEITFNYKFPAMGANFNNSFVLRVIDQDNNAVLSLDNSDAYSSSEITRLYDDQNSTTLFIFNNLKTIYTDNSGAIINTVKIDYDNIPVISGKVININGAYDEFMLKDGEIGQEIHPVYNALHSQYPALNAPTKYNDSSNFLNCNDNSSGTTLFVNSNNFPWVLNDLPIDMPWVKEGVSILEAYPNFDEFVMSNSALDWYSDINGNRVTENLNK